MKKRFWLHILFWLIYFVWNTYYEYEYSTHSYKDILLRIRLSSSSKLLHLTPKLILCYSVGFILWQNFKKKKTNLRAGFEIFFLLVFITFLHRAISNYLTFPYIYHTKIPKSIFEISRLANAAEEVITVLCLFGAIKLFRFQIFSKEYEKQLVKEKFESEIRFLRSQTNPHFLFNTLNNIYALARKKDDNTAEVVMKLSKLMRFMLYECKNDQIKIIDEITVIEEYLALEKLRYDKRLSISFVKEIDNQDEQISPLLLLPFVENAFKHGASESRFDIYINIIIVVRKGILYFDIENSTEKNKKEIVENIGLSNTKRQLELLYDDYDLKIEAVEEKFFVKLKVNLRNEKN